MRSLCKRLLTLALAVIPVLCLTVSAANALWCAVAVFFSLLLSCAVRVTSDRIIPASAKNICIIIAVALGISLVEVFTAGALSADESASAFMPLCAVPAILLLGMTSDKKGIKPTFLEALKLSGLFAALMVLIGAVREIIGSGTLFGFAVTKSVLSPIRILTIPAGAIFVIALIIAILQLIAKEDAVDA